MTLHLETIQYAAHTHHTPLTPLNDNDANALQDISDVLFKHNADRRFGIRLLENTMTLNADEAYMETTDVEGRISMLNIIEANPDNLDNSMPTIWSFGNDEIKAMANCRTWCKISNFSHTTLHVGYGRNAPGPSFFKGREAPQAMETSLISMHDVDYASLTDIDDVPPMSLQDEAIMEELRTAIKLHGMEHRLGIALLHKHFEVNEGEMAIELEQPEEKRIVTFVAKKEDVEHVAVPSILRFTRH